MHLNFLPSAVANHEAQWGLSLFAILVTILWLRYRANLHSFAAATKKQHSPPTYPYLFPVLGSLPLAYLWKPRDVVLNPKYFFQSAQETIRVKILHEEVYLIRGAENVKALFKAPVTSIPFIKFALSYAFGASAKALTLYDKDDSGLNYAPHPDSNVEPRNRIDYLVHHSTKGFLEGPGLNPLWNRYLQNISAQLETLQKSFGPQNEWQFHNDFIALLAKEVTVATINAFWGPHFFSLNPDFIQHFDAFDENLQIYMQGRPSFLAPKAYRARQQGIDAVKKWHKYARDNWNPSCQDATDNESDSLWGSKFFREMHDAHLAMGDDGEFGYDAIASSDFGFIWATRNAITATDWVIYHAFRDKELLDTVRGEVDACLNKTGGVYDEEVIQRNCPVLAAVYAETLRLRTHFYLVRMGDRGKPLSLLGWVIPPKKPVVALTTVAHFDERGWDVGLNGEYPLDVFWPGRFLKSVEGGKKGEVEFVTKGMEGRWVPYGGGVRMCPGKHFAKRHIMVTTALMVSMFDVEFVDDSVKENLTLMGFGGGVSRLVGRAGVKMRRREADKA
ncbi:25-hydroxycholesterol 7-alpha-hydroxylase [Cladorrhinum sp. PSN259]|nr:25-hydroxycholesterol 7-alpha-hydroxylase [Cladorrhinum sp. PSN259]